MVYFTCLDVLKQHPKRYVAQQLKDEEGLFWRLVGVFPQNNGFVLYRDLVIATDTLDELKVFCDLHNVKIHHKEKYKES